jgi:hypothetical protein
VSAELTTDTLAVGDRDGMVCLQFPKPVQWCTLDPDTARNVGEAMARQAYVTQYGAAPSRSAITVAIQQKLINRVSLLLRNRPNERPELTAHRLVDIVLSEVDR